MIVRRPDVKAVGYFASITSIVYGLSAIFFTYLTSNPSLTMRLIVVISYFALMLIAAAVFCINPFKPRNSAPYLDSLVHTLALTAAGSLLVTVAWIAVYGFSMNISALYLQAKPAFVSSWSVNLPVFALIFWGINGLIVAYFYHSATYELFERAGRPAGVAAATTLFTLNYNAPLLSNYWNTWDIAFFGFIFAYSYSVKRNPLALFTTYLLFEVPLWWCILAPFGEKAFGAYFFLRIILSAIALVALVHKMCVLRCKSIRKSQ